MGKGEPSPGPGPVGALERFVAARRGLAARRRAGYIPGMEWKASHILVRDEALARRLQQEIKQGARFEDLARLHSTCPSKSSGGDLGWFGPGKMVKEFEDACKKVGVGTVTDPVKTQFGYHLIKVTGKK